MIAFPVRVLGFELVDLKIVLAHEQCLQCRERGFCARTSPAIMMPSATIGRLLPSDTFMCPSGKPRLSATACVDP